MTKKIRLTILVFCVVCFFIIAPYIILYSLGYRVDFENKKIVATGGIYIRTFPTAEQIIIDSKISQKPGMFNNSIFIQSLLPKDHTILIKKSGYYDYYKTLDVLEKEVTKLENILLIKNNVAFLAIDNNVDYFSLAPNNKNILATNTDAKGIKIKYFSLTNTTAPSETLLKQSGKISNIKWSDDSILAIITLQTPNTTLYFLFDSLKQTQTVTQIPLLDKNSQQISFNPQNSQEIFFIKNKILYLLNNNKTTTVVSNVATYAIDNGNIIWFPIGGPLYKSDHSGKLLETMSPTLPASTVNAYNKILAGAGQIFAIYNGNLFLLDQNNKLFKSISKDIMATDMKISPNGQGLLYCSDSKIFYYDILTTESDVLFLDNSNKITDCFWLNNDYVIFKSGNKIIISEIDHRGNINNFTLPQTANKIFFNSQDNKLYILTEKILLASEKLTP
jgi:hypothetical protein